MKEDIAAIIGRDVSRETIGRLQEYRHIVIAEAEKQNLVARSTLEDFDRRHIVDAAQLLAHGSPGQSWLDIGSGAGLPGMVIAILHDGPVTLCEPRALRANFLRETAAALDLRNVHVVHAKVDKVAGQYDRITARAVAHLDRLFAMAFHCSHSRTKWVLPKGRTAQNELEEARATWQGEFCTVPSLTDPDASIIVARSVKRRGKS